MFYHSLNCLFYTLIQKKKKKKLYYRSFSCFSFQCSYAFVKTSNSCFPNIAKTTVFKFSAFDNSRATVDIANGAASFNG